MDDTIRTPREYELSFLVRDEKAVPEVFQAIKRVGAEINLEGQCRRITLAYPIKKENNAYFGFFYFTVLPEKIIDIDKELLLKDAVLRHLFISPPIRRKDKRVIPQEGEKVSAPPRREVQRTESLPLSNEDLERKIGEILG